MIWSDSWDMVSQKLITESWAKSQKLVSYAPGSAVTVLNSSWPLWSTHRDRIECLHELASTIKTSKGVEIKDNFCGDKPAQQFERGTQIGGPTSTRGKRTPGVLKPMDSLKVNERLGEPKNRGTKEQLKPELNEKLSSTLRGAQRVQSLLMFEDLTSSWYKRSSSQPPPRNTTPLLQTSA